MSAEAKTGEPARNIATMTMPLMIVCLIALIVFLSGFSDLCLLNYFTGSILGNVHSPSRISLRGWYMRVT